ncbi:hypothetical protein U4U11_24770, partial [Escherichia coli]|nr:hypothetical protein [Escherichia coli]
EDNEPVMVFNGERNVLADSLKPQPLSYRENGQLFVLFLHNDFSIQDDRNHAPSPARAKCLVQTITLTG